jgi:hypothetical protein
LTTTPGRGAAAVAPLPPLVYAPLFLGLLVGLSVPLGPGALAAQGAGARGGVGGAAPVLEAMPATFPIVVDGRLDEPVWGEAPPAWGFVQREPRPGTPASEDTEVRVLYDERGVYFGIRAHDSEPGRLVRDLHGRDVAPLSANQFWGQDDAVALILDTFHDGRNGYYFSVNPNGARTDGLISNEGQLLNFDWQGVWEAGATVDEGGWTAEIFIPWSTLRFPATRTPTVGLNVQRVIRRRTEETYWSPLGLSEDLWWVSRAGTLEGLELPTVTRPVEAKPFVTGSRGTGPSFGGSERAFEPGIDVKVGLRDGLTADFTYNTDFAQVEVDEQQVNLTRFPLLFPEKREFFLENAGVFEVGVENFSRLFFSRRIGLDPDGGPVPIQVGGRVQGRVGGGVEMGALSIRTEGTPTAARASHSVLRARRNLGRRNTAGVLLTNLNRGGDEANNRVMALDWDLNPWRYLGFEGYLARSSTDGLSGEEWSTGGILHWNTDEFGVRFVFHEHQENFTPGMGFLPRPAIRHYQPGARVGFRPEWDRVRRIVLRSTLDHVFDREWELLSRNVMTHTIWTLESQDGFTIQRNDRFELLARPFSIRPDVVIGEGEYRFTTHMLRFNASPQRRLSGRVQYEWGDFFGGDRRTWSLEVGVRPNAHVSVLPRYERNVVRLPEGDFTTNLGGLRVNVAPTNRLMLNAFVQYNDATEQVSTNLRLDFIHRPGSNLFLVYNDTRDMEGDRWAVQDRQQIVKLTYLWRFR